MDHPVEWIEWMSHRKREETKQQPGTARPGNILGCCLVSLCFLCVFDYIYNFTFPSTDPNLAIFNVWIDCLDPDLPRICLFAKRDIARGEQLTFDYCQDTTQNSGTEFSDYF